ncbi:MAG TPA: hypothetical protein VFE37_27505 [Chloroflexota bacterium]|nr:hypothetical protein [Chloroflexota bacterium]
MDAAFGEPRVKVRLKVDLTAYLAGLVAGSEGYTVGRYGPWSRSFDRFVGVHFPGIGTLDVLWSSLEIIDEAYLRAAADEEARRWEALKSAQDVVVVRGPKGGFRCLSYRYTTPEGAPAHISIGFRGQAERELAFFYEHGIPVTERRET